MDGAGPLIDLAYYDYALSAVPQADTEARVPTTVVRYVAKDVVSRVV